jgi:hypothetical protein
MPHLRRLDISSRMCGLRCKIVKYCIAPDWTISKCLCCTVHLLYTITLSFLDTIHVRSPECNKHSTCIYRLAFPAIVFCTAPMETRKSSNEKRVFISAAGKDDEALLNIVANEKAKAGDFSWASSGNRSLRNSKAILKSRPCAAIGAEK